MGEQGTRVYVSLSFRLKCVFIRAIAESYGMHIFNFNRHCPPTMVVPIYTQFPINVVLL